MRIFTETEVHKLVEEIDELFHTFLKKEVTETRVYVIDAKQEHLRTQNILEWDDQSFMEEAENQGKIYTLALFQIAFNLEDVDTRTQYIRILTV